MVGAGAEESVHTPVVRSVMRRQPWLVVNLLMGVLIAAAISSPSCKPPRSVKRLTTP